MFPIVLYVTDMRIVMGIITIIHNNFLGGKLLEKCTKRHGHTILCNIFTKRKLSIKHMHINITCNIAP